MHNRKKKLNERKTPLLSAIDRQLFAAVGVNQPIFQQGAFASLQNYSNKVSASSVSDLRKTAAPRVLRIAKRRKGKKISNYLSYNCGRNNAKSHTALFKSCFVSNF